jgi:protein translocase SEC61 complex gamma subunit
MLSMRFINRCMRVLHIARKPTKKEVDEILKVTGLGMIFIGTFGMVMYLIFNFLKVSL